MSSIKSLQAIAADWHSGQGSALYAYASTGTILPWLSSDVVKCFPYARPKELVDLKRLYVAIAPLITRENIAGIDEFWHRFSRNADGTPIRARRNGKTRVWKTRPQDFSQPVKHGLKSCFNITPDNVADWCAAPQSAHS